MSAYFSGTHIDELAGQHGLRYRGGRGLLGGCDDDIEKEGGGKKSKRTNKHIGVHVTIHHAVPPKKKLHPIEDAERPIVVSEKVDCGASEKRRWMTVQIWKPAISGVGAPDWRAAQCIRRCSRSRA